MIDCPVRRAGRGGDCWSLRGDPPRGVMWPPGPRLRRSLSERDTVEQAAWSPPGLGGQFQDELYTFVGRCLLPRLQIYLASERTPGDPTWGRGGAFKVVF